MTPWVRALLGQLDVIRLWSLALMVYGMSVISKKSVMQSAVVVVTIWAFTVLLTTWWRLRSAERRMHG